MVQDDLVHFFVGLENHFRAHIRQQAFELHAHGCRATATTGVFSAQHDHRVFALHDDIASADFLSDFHNFNGL